MLQIIDDAQAPVVIVGPDFFEQVEKLEHQLATVSTIVAIGDHPRWVGYDQWIDAPPDTDPGLHATGAAVAFQPSPASTTGLPQGGTLTYAHFLNRSEERSCWESGRQYV